MDSGVCGTSIYTTRHIHSSVPQGFYYYAPHAVINTEKGSSTEGWSVQEALLEEEAWGKGKGCLGRDR